MSLPKKILVATDFEGCANSAVEAGLAWAKRFEAELHFVHVIERLSAEASPSGEPLMVHYVEEARHYAKERSRDLESLARDRGLQAEFHLQEGHAAQEVLALAERLSADCILVGSHGRTGLAHLWFGSVAERIARRAPCSVMIVRSDRSAGRPGTILFGDDLKPGSLAARSLALEVAGALEARVVVLHSLELGVPYLSMVEVVVPNRLFDEAFEQARRRLDDLAKETPEVAIENVVVGDRPAHELCARSEAREVGLVVVGCDSRTQLDRWLLGTVAERAVRHAECSVLVVRDPR